jgi:hypothetical protein
MEGTGLRRSEPIDTGKTISTPTANRPIPASLCTSKPDCLCEVCTVTRFRRTEEDAVALEFIAKLQLKK